MAWALVSVVPLATMPWSRELPAQAAAPALQSAIPDRLTDTEFWDLVAGISEPGGYFRITDNFTSNEPEIGVLFGELEQRGVRGGVYIGVGPEQNLTYIAAIRPEMAFIIDIRRQAVMQHLMFKALFELSDDRADFIAMLFARPRPEGLDTTSNIQRIWEAFASTVTDPALALRTRARIVDQLTLTHGFGLTSEEVESLKYVYDSFVAFGPAITTRGSRSYRGAGNSSTFVDLTGWARDATGEPRSFLSSEENYRVVKRLQARNLVVPVSGDFAGPKALRAIGAWVSRHGGVVSAFYVSNVEQYLIQDGKLKAFYDNAAFLPRDPSSVFIRPYSLRRQGFNYAICAMVTYLNAVLNGQIDAPTDRGMCGP